MKFSKILTYTLAALVLCVVVKFCFFVHNCYDTIDGHFIRVYCEES